MACSNVFCLLLPLIAICIQLSEGGSCWTKTPVSGNCGRLLETGVTLAQCCKGNSKILRSNQLLFSKRDAKDPKALFFLIFINPPRQCRACPNPCSGMSCGANSRASCVLAKTKGTRCICTPDCKDTFQGKVCSTDQRTYLSECSLLTESCRARKKIEIDYFLQCQESCASVKCPAGKFCVEDQYKLPHCISNTICTTKCPTKEDDEMLCGTNGVTYRNLCFLRKVVCRAGTEGRVGIAYKGKCKGSASCKNIRCSKRNKCLKDGLSVRCVKCDGYCIGSGPDRPVCGSDGQLYDNWCSLRKSACESGQHIEVSKNGRCKGKSGWFFMANYGKWWLATANDKRSQTLKSVNITIFIYLIYVDVLYRIQLIDFHFNYMYKFI